MSHETPNTKPDSSWQTTTLLFKKISEIQPADIEKFRQQIKHNASDIFDALTPDKQEVMVAIHSMTDAELATLAAQSEKYKLGIHDIDLYITTIHELTEDPRFEKFIK